MKKFVLFSLTFLAAVTAIIISCDKAVKVPVSYTVVTNHDTFVENIFIPDTGTYTMPILVKYYTGYTQDPVTLKITGLPSDIAVTPATSSAIPTYNQNFVFYTNHATHGTYNASIVASAPGELAQTYNFTVTVVPANCASPLYGTMTCTDSCNHAGKYSYPATVSGNGTSNTIIINNFGGYGTNANATVLLNCDNDSLTIQYQNIGNGTLLSGTGTYTTTSMVIYYNATNTPTGGSESCVTTLTK